MCSAARADTLEILLRRGRKGQGPLEPLEWKAVKARVAWVRETVEALREAQRHMDERCMAAVDRVPEAEFNRIFDEEQAKVSAILDQLNAVRDHDRWPEHLRCGGF
ncbi:MAG: hypothetical protein ACM3ZV_06925 [Bacillota bacterium]